MGREKQQPEKKSRVKKVSLVQLELHITMKAIRLSLEAEIIVSARWHRRYCQLIDIIRFFANFEPCRLAGHILGVDNQPPARASVT